MTTDLERLIEGAAEGSRELDARIAAALRILPEHPGTEWVAKWDGPFIPNPSHNGIGKGRVALQNGAWWESKRYTTSIDAAMMLVPADAFWRIGHDGDGADPSLFKATIGVAREGEVWISFRSAVADTPPLALCAAALKARALSLTGEERG